MPDKKLDAQDEAFIAEAQAVLAEVEKGKDLASGDALAAFEKSVGECQKTLETIKAEGRNLTIGIVGEVKAGKSSFLNALLFDGEDFLPKAATPMTAALTRVSYDVRPHAVISYYQPSTWDYIVGQAKKYDEIIDAEYQKRKQRYDENLKRAVGPNRFRMPTREDVEKTIQSMIGSDIKGCRELVEMVRKSGLEVSECLGKTEEIDGDVLGRLNDYVGADGRMTPIVESTEVFIDNPKLEGLTIIDTPGLNDPVSSRSQRTKEYLKNCDVVFLLSYTGQFLTKNDLEFMNGELPSAGVKKIVLVASKFDSGVSDYPTRGVPFETACRGTAQNCQKQAESNIAACLASEPSEVMLQLQRSLPPQITSSMLYKASKCLRDGRPYDAETAFVIEGLKKAFGASFTETADYLQAVAGFDTVNDKVMAQVRSEKAEIIAARVREATSTQRAALLSQLEDIANGVRGRLNDLRNSGEDGAEQLRAKLERSTHQLDRSRVEVKALFENSGLDTKIAIRGLEDQISSASRTTGKKDIAYSTSETRTRTRHHFGDICHFFDQSSDYTVTTYHANVGDAAQAVTEYADRCNELINSASQSLFDVKALSEAVTRAVMKMFDTTDDSYDKNDILLPLGTALRKISIPEERVESGKYEKMIIEKFPGSTVDGNAINDLKMAMRTAKNGMRDDTVAALERMANDIINQMNTLAGTFIDDIAKKLRENTETTRKLLEDREGNIKRCEEYIDSINGCKARLSGD